MATITRPRNGGCFRITRAGYVDGIFIIDGKRAFKGLCKMADIEVAPSGRKRTLVQLNAIVQQMWDEKREAIEAELGRVTGSTSPVSQALEDWKAHTEAKGRSPLTLSEIARTSRYYLEIVGEHPVGEAATWHADTFLKGLRERDIAEASINTHLSRLATFWRFCLDRELIVSAPKVTRVKEIRKPRRVPTPEQVAALLVHLDGKLSSTTHGREQYFLELHRLLVLVLLGTGMRSGEALNIQRKHIDLDNRAIQLEKTKTNQPRICRIPRFLAEAIAMRQKAYPFQQYLFGHPTQPAKTAWKSTAALTKAFTRHYEDIGIQGEFKPLHGFRALFATAGLNNVGVDPLVMMNQIGHADIKTTQNYYVASMQDAQLRAVDAIEEGFLAKVLGRV